MRSPLNLPSRFDGSIKLPLVHRVHGTLTYFRQRVILYTIICIASVGFLTVSSTYLKGILARILANAIIFPDLDLRLNAPDSMIHKLDIENQQEIKKKKHGHDSIESEYIQVSVYHVLVGSTRLMIDHWRSVQVDSINSLCQRSIPPRALSRSSNQLKFRNEIIS